MPPRSSTCSLKPPALPIPGTGGGGTAMMKASCTAWSRPNSALTSAGPDCDGPAFSRSSKGPKRANTTAAFEAFVKVAPEKPAKATAFVTPGVLRMMSVAFWSAASVRESDAPSGVWMTTIA